MTQALAILETGRVDIDEVGVIRQAGVLDPRVKLRRVLDADPAHAMRIP
jgi:hypothetical protein